jgi:division protein CdvB (Snf7/Vps24/ESCRT-III family)
MQKTKFKCVENILNKRAQSPACQTKSKGFRLFDRGEDNLFSQQELFTLIKGLHVKVDQLHSKMESFETRLSELAKSMPAQAVHDELKQWLDTQHKLTSLRDIKVEVEPHAEAVTYTMELSDAVLENVTCKMIKNYDFSSEVELRCKGFQT